jgi:hypothetical protein
MMMMTLMNCEDPNGVEMQFVVCMMMQIMMKRSHGGKSSTQITVFYNIVYNLILKTKEK